MCPAASSTDFDVTEMTLLLSSCLSISSLLSTGRSHLKSKISLDKLRYWFETARYIQYCLLGVVSRRRDGCVDIVEWLSNMTKPFNNQSIRDWHRHLRWRRTGSLDGVTSPSKSKSSPVQTLTSHSIPTHVSFLQQKCRWPLYLPRFLLILSTVFSRVDSYLK